MKILWHSNVPWGGTGYGAQTALFAPMIRDAGYDLALSSTWGLQGSAQTWDGLTVYPDDGQMGNLTLPNSVRHWSRGEDCLVITLLDVWTLANAEFREMNMACWTPVDHDPIPPRVAEVLHAALARPIAMSRFGEKALKDAGLDPLYVPHGIDTNVFKPKPQGRAEYRSLLGLDENAFVIGMVAANKGNAPVRKSFPQVMEAFARFEKERENAYLYLHTEITGKHEGVNIPDLARALDIPGDKLKFTPPGIFELGLAQSDLATVYSSFDVLANPSYGEGFGVPIVEAQACGVSVITTDWTAMPELTGAGWMVDGDRWWHQSTFFKCPSVKGILNAFRKAHKARGDEVLRRKAREFALQYDADRVFTEHWLPVLEELTRPKAEPSAPEVIVRQAA